MQTTKEQTTKEPQICPNCPRRSLLNEVRAKSWNNVPTEETTVMLCAKLRAYKNTYLPRCPEFPENENMDIWLGLNQKSTHFKIDKNPTEYISPNHFSLRALAKILRGQH